MDDNYKEEDESLIRKLSRICSNARLHVEMPWKIIWNRCRFILCILEDDLSRLTRKVLEIILPSFWANRSIRPNLFFKNSTILEEQRH